MAHDCHISQAVRDTQERIFRIAQRKGLTLQVISLDSGIPYSTLRSYAGHNGATAEMPVSALRKLEGVLPDELLSLLLTEERAIVRVPAEIDHDELERAMLDYVSAKAAFHHPGSECAEKIGPHERDVLNAKVVCLPIRGMAA